ncbi:MAG: sigma 54-interacting transcriptional regulator, partial [candidate division Zixibacteria bacterium]|nr:sigma 54-interacting transcriptional regulator [candidate division Zixibacteria bacterium]
MKIKAQIIQILGQARRFLQENKHRASLDLLSSLDASDLDLSSQGDLYLLKAECLLFLGDYNHDYPDRAIQVYKATSEHSLFAQAKYLKGWQLQNRGEYREAKEALLEAYSSFLRVDDFTTAARTLNRLAFICLLAGDIDQAINNLKKCVEIHQQASNTDKVRVCENNLALIYRKAGRIRESLALYRAGLDKCDMLDEHNRCVFYLGYAVPKAQSGDIKGAKRLLEQAHERVNGYQREEAIYYEYLGWVLIIEEAYEAAEKALRRGLKIAADIAPGSDHDSQMKRLLADICVARGDFDRAEQFALEALEVAGKINEQVEIAACYRVLALVEQHRGNNPQAREWFKKAIALFNRISARYELAVTRYRAATCGLYANGERTALIYLAREYFESEKITPYVEKIDRLLAQSAKPNDAAVEPERHRLPENGECPTIVAVNYKMKKILEFARHVARSEMNVLLTGATGTGKDLMARYIHYFSGRKGKLITVNAAAVPNSMVESELFGYARGAFTGADLEKPGIFEEVDGGTFYLNEIADATPEFQAKLLEVLETRQVRRLGETKTRPVDFRLIAATNHDLNERIKNGLFRLDLYHRLNEIPIELPALDERADDIPAMVEYFLMSLGKDVRENGNRGEIEQLGAVLSHRSWPGNVRH